MKKNVYQFFLLTSLVLLGWNLSVALALIVIIFLIIILASFGVDVGYTSVAFIASAIFAGALGLGIGVRMGINAKEWFVSRKTLHLVLLWIILLGLTLVMFPSRYNQMIFDMIS